MLEFRKIESEEYDLIKEHLENSFNLREFEGIIEPFEIIVVEGKWKEILFVTDDLLNVYEVFREYRNPYTMGLHFGDIRRNRFKISLEGMTLIATFVDQKTILTKSGEKKVVYRRDLNKEDLSYIPAQIQEGDLSILINEDEEVLALGKYLFGEEKIRSLRQGQKVLKNIIDKGWYLRQGE